MDKTIFDFLTVEKPEGYSSSCILPDHSLLGAAGDAWVAGAYEGLLMRSLYSIRRPAAVNYLLARKVRRQIVKPSDKNREIMHRALIKAAALPVVDPLISFLTTFALPRTAVAAEARYLATQTQHRELVKVGMALLGSFGEPEDIDGILLPLGRHEEFTFYAAPAIRALLGDSQANEVLLPLAEDVDGWGRLAVLYELNFEDPAAQEFLLRRGCRNWLGFAESANLCATKGGLAPRLESFVQDGTMPDEELYRGICDIFTGLLMFDGTHDSLEDYKHSHRARVAFAALYEAHPELSSLDGRTGEILDKMR